MDIKKIQEMNRVILNEVVRVCNKYKICYYLDSGALLGAVRHKSFIPWDDDVDISFRREEYNKFRAAIKKEWKETDYMLHEPQDMENETWLDWISCVVHKAEQWERKEKKMDEKNMEAFGRYPYIDVFIIDAVPDDKIKQIKLFVKLIVDYGLAMGHRPSIYYEEYRGISKITVRILSHIGRHIPLKKIIKAYKKHCTMYQDKMTDNCFFSNYSIRAFTKVYKSEWFGRGSKVQLDGVFYNAPDNVHEYLKMTYGDYMKLPPVEERKPKHFEL